jgi:protocatechuate 3,4-dioxygenase beta subunit
MNASRVGLLLLALALLSGLLWVALREPRSGMEPARVPPTPTLTPTAAPLDSRAGFPEPTEIAQPTPVLLESSRTEAATPAPDAAPALPVPIARVHGRVLDDRGRPLPTAQVGLHSASNSPWREDLATPKFQWSGRTRSGYTATPDTDGRFALEVPVPTSDWVILLVEADQLHGTHRRNFGIAGGRNQPPLVAGDNALGDIVLPEAACLQGRIVDESGRPVKSAEALIGSHTTSSAAHAKSGDDGAFRIERAPPGRWLAWAERDGYLTSKTRDVELSAGQTLDGIELVLQPAPSIEGIVVDENSTPLPSVRVWAWPVGSGKGAGATSGADGRFTLYLPQNESYRMDFGHTGYDAYGGEGTTAVFKPGSRDVRLVLRRALRFEFRVVDAETNAPITRFGLATANAPAANRSSSEDRAPTRLSDSPDGRREVAADPARHWIRCEAPGRAPYEGPIEPDEPNGSRQTLRLERGGSVRGRVACAESPSLRLQRQAIRIDPTQPEVPEQQIWFSSNYRYDLSEFFGRVRDSVGAADGSFEFGGLASGTYRLDVLCAGKAPTRYEHLAIVAGQVLELGVLEPDAPAMIEGRVLVAAGRSPAGLVVHVDAVSPVSGITLGPGGEFQFENLSRGDHKLLVADLAGICFQAEALQITLASGERRRVTWDLAVYCPARLCVEVRAAGEDVSGLTVSWGTDNRWTPLGSTDSAGRCCGPVRAGRELSLLVQTKTGQPVGRGALPDVPLAGTEHRLDLELQCGRLCVQLDPALELPTDGGLQLLLRCANPAGFTSRHFRIGELYPFGQELFPEDRRVDFGLLEAGDWNVSLHALRQASTVQWDSQQLAETSVRVAPRQPATCTLRAGS